MVGTDSQELSYHIASLPQFAVLLNEDTRYVVHNYGIGADGEIYIICLRVFGGVSVPNHAVNILEHVPAPYAAHRCRRTKDGAS